MWGWLNHALGLDDLSGPIYGAWSGFGGDLGELAIVGAVVAGYRKHVCHVKRCPRLGKHAVEGTPYVVCAKHHPEVAGKEVTHEHILDLHRRHRRLTP